MNSRSHTLSCYHIDEPLSEEELVEVSKALLGPFAFFKTGATSLVQLRVSSILPMPEKNGKYANDPMQRVKLIRANLRNAGIQQDQGKQVVWVMPQDIGWGTTFQLSIQAETGFYPYAVQRWRYENDKMVRGPVRVINTNGLMGDM